MLDGRHPRLVLIADDDLELASHIGAAIERRGYRAICVGSGRDALLALEIELPSLVLLDRFMPLDDGADLLTLIKSSPRWSILPRVIMTATNDLMMSVKENAHVLYKPFDLDVLATLLATYCEPPRAGPANLFV